MEIEKLILWALTTLVSAFLGSYLGAYLKKKAENKAIHEDLRNLIEQVKAVTTTTKTIEAKISDDIWRQQRHWELKREALFDVVKKMRSAEAALLSWATTTKLSIEGGDPAMGGLKAKAGHRWVEASNALDEAIYLVAVVCSSEVTTACERLGFFMLMVSGKANEDPTAYFGSLKELQKLSVEAGNAIRKEFELLR